LTRFLTNIDTVTLADSLFITGIVWCGNVIAVAKVFSVQELRPTESTAEKMIVSA